MYAVRTKTGRVVRRFATRAAAEHFVRGSRTSRSPSSLLEQRLAEFVSIARQPSVDQWGTNPPLDEKSIKHAVAAAKRVSKLIAEVEQGDESVHHKAASARHKLDDMAFKTMPAPVRDAYYEVGKALGQRLQESSELGRQARQAARTKEMADSRQREADRLANMTYDQRAHWQYEQELKLLKGGR
jgi:hypothetical protein